MSGHSKWSKVKHQKAVTDAVKGQAFTKASRAITIAVREGGGIADPNGNFRLRLAIEKAREVNMPKENIDRAIEKGKGAGGQAIEQILYEAYGPGGVALLIEAATDNRQRTVSDVKHQLDRAGGTLASPGAVSYLFSRSGIVTVAKKDHSMDELTEAALEVGADDIVETADVFELYTNPHAVSEVKKKLEEKGIAIDNAAFIMKPVNPVSVDAAQHGKIDTLISQLEALDDVQQVYTNVEHHEAI